MDTKLTLKLDKEVIEEAKKYAASRKRSLSKLIEAYLRSLTIRDESIVGEDIEISPYVKGMASGTSVPIDVDIKYGYKNHLNMKYK